MDFTVADDLLVIKELTEYTWADLAEKLEVEESTLFRWLDLSINPSEKNIEKIYSFAFSRKIRLNEIYGQIFKESYADELNAVLFHGAKTDIKGELTLDCSGDINDFGKGFYCGESIEQSAMFISNYPKSTLYTISFSKEGLKGESYTVSREWMLTIAYFRHRLGKYGNHPFILSLRERVRNADYILAPIADNKMFQLIDSFIDGEITDEQCIHSLAATDLGLQHVFVSEKALRNIRILRHGWLASEEKKFYLQSRQEAWRIGEDKVKIARRAYRGKGLYIDEILK